MHACIVLLMLFFAYINLRLMYVIETKLQLICMRSIFMSHACLSVNRRDARDYFSLRVYVEMIAVINAIELAWVKDWGLVIYLVGGELYIGP